MIENLRVVHSLTCVNIPRVQSFGLQRWTCFYYMRIRDDIFLIADAMMGLIHFAISCR
ncbi:Uncharacterized protein APZ42_029446 [Daphnia magna]|uniref:Uncharacterized protein n=1 Tax=Daphnia magna TaxID=35525 RepID=A0A164PJH3_9CRUS|nr:Uncharacterized protein APZ42_029446 [Daphnia magna]